MILEKIKGDKVVVIPDKRIYRFLVKHQVIPKHFTYMSKVKNPEALRDKHVICSYLSPVFLRHAKIVSEIIMEYTFEERTTKRYDYSTLLSRFRGFRHYKIEEVVTPSKLTTIVTRHPGLVDYFKELKLVDATVKVVEHLSKENMSEIENRQIAGFIPLGLSSRAESVTLAEIRRPRFFFKKELSKEHLLKFAQGIFTLRIKLLNRRTLKYFMKSD